MQQQTLWTLTKQVIWRMQYWKRKKEAFKYSSNAGLLFWKTRSSRTRLKSEALEPVTKPVCDAAVLEGAKITMHNVNNDTSEWFYICGVLVKFSYMSHTQWKKFFLFAKSRPTFCEVNGRCKHCITEYQRNKILHKLQCINILQMPIGTLKFLLSAINVRRRKYLLWASRQVISIVKTVNISSSSCRGVIVSQNVFSGEALPFSPEVWKKRSRDNQFQDW